MRPIINSMTYGFILFFLGISSCFADTYPQGGIVFHNASNKTVTAEVTSIGKIKLAAQEEKDVSYSTLSHVCSSNPTHCVTRFYANDMPVGYATINAKQGKVVNMNILMKVNTTQDQKVLRSVTIY